MKEIISFLSNNIFEFISIVLSAIAVILSINTNSKNRKLEMFIHREQEKNNKIKNKPDLKIEPNKLGDIESADLDVAVIPLYAVFVNGKLKIEFPEKIYDLSNYKSKTFIFKNVGKSTINHLHVIGCNKRELLVTEYKYIRDVFKYQYLCYDALLDKRIFIGEEVCIKIYYCEEYLMQNFPGSTLSLIYEDSNGLKWEQPFFYNENKLYEPFLLTSEEFKQRIMTDDAYKCFKEPHTW